MAIKTSTPVTEPARVYDNIWLEEITVKSPCGESIPDWAALNVIIALYDSAGKVGHRKRANIGDVLAMIAAGDKKMTAAFEAILAAVVALEEAGAFVDIE